MQPYKQSISRDEYSRTSRRSDLTNGGLACSKNSLRSTLLLLLRVVRGRKRVKVLVLIDVWMSITIAGVQYLYLGLDYEFWSNKIGFKTWKRKWNFLNYDNLDPNLPLPWNPTCLLASCLLVLADRAHFFEMMTSPYQSTLMAIQLADFAECFGSSLIISDPRVFSSRTKFRCQHTKPSLNLDIQYLHAKVWFF
jgi:hypothetical protein